MRDAIESLLWEVLPEGIEAEVTVPDVPEHGDYSTSVAFAVAKKEGRAPRDVAEDIARRIMEEQKDTKTISRIETAGGGFINFWISDEAAMRGMRGALRRPGGWGKGVRKKETVRIEYFQPNVAKTLHVGHMRSAIIGDALKRIFIAQGYRAVSDTHIGDWGTQFGILLHAWKGLSAAERQAILKNPVQGLTDLYVAESMRIEAEPERREKGKEEFAKLERGDGENRRLWKWMVKVSMIEFREVMRRLGLLQFEEHRPESVYENTMPFLVERALKRGVAIKKEGAVVVDLEDAGLGDAVLLKSDGASTYLLRDLATLEYWNTKKLARNLYVVDVRQAHHFRQVFEAGRRLGIPLASVSEHIIFGFMSLPEGAMSTRKGNVIALLDVLRDVAARARQVIEIKNPHLKHKEAVAEAVGLGALKYFDLSHHPKSNVIFDKEKALAFEGNTGPYLQYTHARLRSILRKAQISNFKFQTKSEFQMTKMGSDERETLVAALQFPEAVEDACAARAPSVLAHYLFSLGRQVNEFYHSHPVLQETDAEIRGFRLALVSLVALTLEKGLYFLGIEAVSEM